MSPTNSPNPQILSLRTRVPVTRREALATVSGAILAGCGRPRNSGPSITFTRIPKADPGGSTENDIIEGMVQGATAGEQVVLYAKSGKWWVQPMVSQPITTLQKSFKWTNATHLGTHYAAVLVKEGYRPAPTLDALPKAGEDVMAVATVPGAAQPPSKMATFSGYQWRLRDAPSGRGGRNVYDPANAWVDEQGAMHLRIAKTETDWSCAEVAMTRSMGYGTYQFVVRDISPLGPAAVFGMFTYDYAGGDQKNREMAIEVSQWGDLTNKNAQYVVQPFYVAANVNRFNAPAGRLTISMRWEHGQVTFRTVRGNAVVAEHVFTSNIPSPGIESIRMVLYVYRDAPKKLRSGTEVVVEQFTYFP